ncbi:MAG: N-acetylmuramoyl-L-alanine amidase [Clostridia bacterium]|nr:N-acetylmuramoyl-L-alanine amidase [Clostridia bacterium]
MRVWILRVNLVTAALLGLCALAAAVARAVWMAAFPPPEPSGWALEALHGRTVAIDPGHGGVDPGSIGRGGTLEKDVVLAIALRLRDHLEAAGARVVLTREEDRDISGYADPWHPDRYRRDLYRRVEIVEASGADVLVSVHANALADRSVRGAQTFYRPDPDGRNRRLAQTLQAELARVTGQANRGTSTDIHQLILRRSPVPAVTVEVGFLSNDQEEALLRDPRYQDRVAWALTLGLARYFAEGGAPAPGST